MAKKQPKKVKKTQKSQPEKDLRQKDDPADEPPYQGVLPERDLKKNLGCG